jgi:creatinine amidohydrolase
MLLSTAKWPEVESYLKTRTDIILPIGSTEQHGPTGLIGTDALTAEAVGRGLGEAVGAYVAPTIAVGQAQHHLGFTGTISLRPSTLLAVVDDYVTSLARHGFTRFYFVNGHGGNVATVNAAFAEIYAKRSFAPGSNAAPLLCAFRNWWEAQGVQKLARELYGDAEGDHATCSEVSLTWHLFPHLADHRVLEPRKAPSYSGIHDASDYRSRYPDGRIGSDTSLARAEHGARLLATAIAGLMTDYRSFAEHAH